MKDKNVKVELPAIVRAAEFVRSMVRPAVTVGLVGAFIAACFVSVEAAKLLAGPMGIAVGFWFRERANT